MKLIIFVIIIAALLTGCANDQYSIEKRFYQVSKRAEKIFSNPAASPVNELEGVVSHLNVFIKKYPQNSLAIKAGFDIASLYTLKGEYQKARAQLKAMLSKYNKSEIICSEAIFLLGNTFEKENKWSPALEQYKKVMQECPLTPRGLSIPMYIAQYYKSKYQPDNMFAALHEAISHYKALADKYPDSPLGLRAHTLVADCYAALNDWQNAINSLKIAKDNYKKRVNVDGIMMDIALIYSRQLKDNIKAKEALEGLLKEYPKSKLAKTATALLKEMEKK